MDIKSKFIVYNKAYVRHFKNKKVPLIFSKRSTFKKKIQLTVDLYSYCFTKIHSHYISGIFSGLKGKIQIILAANHILLFIYYTHTHTQTTFLNQTRNEKKKLKKTLYWLRDIILNTKILLIGLRKKVAFSWKTFGIMLSFFLYWTNCAFP